MARVIKVETVMYTVF